MENATVSPSLENVCRLCLATDEPKLSIFLGDTSSLVPLSLKIQDCLSIQILSGDKLTTLICEGCYKNVNQWHGYRESCLKAQDKLRQWQIQQSMQQPPMGVTIKQEPIDLDFETDQNGVLIESSVSSHELRDVDIELPILGNAEIPVVLDNYAKKIVRDEMPARRKTRSFGSKSLVPNAIVEPEKNQIRIKQNFNWISVKREFLIEDDYDSSFEVESVIGEIVPNPVALSTAKDDRIMEADSTQRSNPTVIRRKRKSRRRPITYMSRKSSFKKKCGYCQIYLHSKYSYGRHMDRFHARDDAGLPTKVENPLRTMSSKANDTADESIDVVSYQTGDMTVGSEADDKDNSIEMIEDVEDEINNMDKNSDTPLSQLQHTIIGQLKTYSCYSCEITFPDRRSTLNHLRQHMPDLRPFTCVACLNQFQNQAAYKHHCASSYECAMKIASVEPKSGTEKYFACNMCSKSANSRKELLAHVAEHADDGCIVEEVSNRPSGKPSFQKDVPPATGQWPAVIGPYENGDPAFNHPCDYCGNIYKRRKNMLVHRDLCSKLPADARICYTCVRCRMTFLQFYKFYNHLGTVHRTTDIVCSKCQKEFKTTSEYLSHDDKYHRNRAGSKSQADQSNETKSPVEYGKPLNDWNAFEAEVHANESRISRQKYSCALCGQEFPTRTELGEHRNLHLKVKIYSCVICRSMFSSARALEVHMKDHGIEDPVEQNAHTSCVEYESAEDAKDPNLVNSVNQESEDKQCKICKKLFSSVANKNRHVSNVHAVHMDHQTCEYCNKQFRSTAKYKEHLVSEHKISQNPTPIRCTECPQTFVNRSNFILHYKVRHDPTREPQGPHTCDICNKEFKQRYSLQIHRGWHNRRLRRMRSDQSPSGTNPPSKTAKYGSRLSNPVAGSSFDNATSTTSKPARARKSFPLAKASRPAPHLKCQVCDHAFYEVTELRTHLWDVHCARNKNEKDYKTHELQCEFCTIVLPDEASLDKHIKWHEANPILAKRTANKSAPKVQSPSVEEEKFDCGFCGTSFGSRLLLYNHTKRQHCGRNNASNQYEELIKNQLGAQYDCNICQKVFSTAVNLGKHRRRHFIKPTDRKRRSVLEKSDFKCEPCNRYYTSVISLSFHHKNVCPFRDQSASSAAKKRKLDTPVNAEAPSRHAASKSAPSTASSFGLSVGWRTKKMFQCSTCRKSFFGRRNLYQHRLEAHSYHTPKKEEPLDEKNVYACPICGKRFPGETNVKLHCAAAHKTKSNTCIICMAICDNAAALKCHMDKHNTARYQCKICKQPFLSRAAVSSHIAGRHSEIYPKIESDRNRLIIDYTADPVVPIEKKPNLPARGSFVCQICGNSFESSRGYKLHMYKSHPGVPR